MPAMLTSMEVLSTQVSFFMADKTPSKIPKNQANNIAINARIKVAGKASVKTAVVSFLVW